MKHEPTEHLSPARVQWPQRVALVHDWLVVYAGAERVLEQLVQLFPHADLFAVVDFLPARERGFILDKPVRTTFVQQLPGAASRYRSYLPLMPLAIEQLDLSGYDLIVSSSHAVAKGVLTGPDQLHVSYVHSPIRYAWDLQHQYLRESGLDRGLRAWLARWILHRVRQWDVRTANGVDVFVANSDFIRRRIAKVYRRDAAVIHPPVDLAMFTQCDTKDDYYLTASRMVPYKRIDLIVEAFARMPDKRLLVVGDGPEMTKVKGKASANVEILGYRPTPELRELMQRARAFVFAAEEDFGIAPVEAQACGTPVIAYGRGGALESVRGIGQTGATGVFFAEQTPAAIIDAVARFEGATHRFAPATCRASAERFAPERFRAAFSALVRQAIEQQYNDRQTMHREQQQ